ncbi:5'-methylthioadenosine phosphorylase [Friedmanniella endophytica]|uniref:Purine nucleoside phosphorylase n=1 Tax=Microlunatus kandeliicorticis TaxID=1759536 RepID=A0A7W3IRK1_9ACTN|nr:S-methyl-5'-thioadenosine phosphorylase [Microlunatus kandeliicorticis]MBA8793961.1 5'-methylthioadenosine phosphorylase [Microlunatus kandeliicorticis]
MATLSRPDIGIIGGSGFYSLFEDAEKHEVETPFGAPSAPVTVGRLGGRLVAFLPRHGLRHEYPPHRVNYRANLWALRAVGVRQVLAPCAVGSLRADLGPGTFVLPDQIIDRTWGREHTVWDAVGPVVHTAFADPYCPRGRAAVLASAQKAAADGPDAPALVDGGTLVVINGPRFSTRAESQWHAAAGGTVVGMTGMPEASIARELAMCCTAVAMVTDHDAGVEAGEEVTHAAVLAVFEQNLSRLRSLLERVVAQLPEPETDDEAVCGCRRSLDGLTLPTPLPT